MRVTIKDFQKNIYKYLKDCPLEIMVRGKIKYLLSSYSGPTKFPKPKYPPPSVSEASQSSGNQDFQRTHFRKTVCKKHKIFTCGCPE